ncbi:hypothetical protein [Vallitalea maricola]|uniref:Uncharacterized protein n=1 Tax=Vallitalea maricola TaxID=3074433 RepID=A0ACB5UGE6_9FIRM|nr:hypothetical protein AN2V17_08670 [Vallitalea sp. AN17-2]
MEIKLPLAIPPLTGRMHIAFPLAIMLTKEHNKVWFYNHYIQMMCSNDYDEYGVLDYSFYVGSICNGWWNNPLLEVQFFKTDLIFKSKKDILDFSINMLKDNYYILTQDLDYFRKKFLKKSRTSYHYIFGCNTKEKVFYTVGHQKGYYGNNQVSFKDFIDDMKTYTNQELVLLKVKESPLEIDLPFIRKQIHDYVYSRNSSEDLKVYQTLNTTFSYGLKTYDNIFNYFIKLLDGKVKNDIRIPYILWEHKNCMYLRLRYINSNVFKINEDVLKYSKELVSKASMIKNYTLRSIIEDNPKYIEKPLRKLEELKREELKIMMELLDIIPERKDTNDEYCD